MNLIDAATRMLFPTKTYRMRWVIVHDIIRHDFAGPAERKFSRFTSSYTTSGDMNGNQAGMSITASYDMPMSGWLDKCNAVGSTMQLSVQHDKALLAAELDDQRNAMSVIAERRKLTNLQVEIEEGRRKLKEAEEKKAEAEQRHEAAALPWAESVRAELQAVRDNERMAELAKLINHLL